MHLAGSSVLSQDMFEEEEMHESATLEHPHASIFSPRSLSPTPSHRHATLMEDVEETAPYLAGAGSHPPRGGFVVDEPSFHGDVASSAAPTVEDGATEETKRPGGTMIRGAAVVTAHTIDDLLVSTRRLDATALAQVVAAASVAAHPRTSRASPPPNPGADRPVTWIELDEPDTSSLADQGVPETVVAALERSRLHGVASAALLAPSMMGSNGSETPAVERLGRGWTLWSAMLPSTASDRRVTLVAACSDRLVVSRVRVGDDDSPPVGGWWKSRRSLTRKQHPSLSRPSFSRAGSLSQRGSSSSSKPPRGLYARPSDASADANDLGSPLLPTATLGRRRRGKLRQRVALREDEDDRSGEAAAGNDDDDDDDEEEDDSGKYVRANGRGPQYADVASDDASDDNDGASSSPCALVLQRLQRDDDERRRLARLGGPYLCAKLVEAALAIGRDAFREFDETISQLTHVCTDEKPGWRNRRVRFNRTVGMLLEAGKARAHIARLREYYDQAHLVARAAASVYAAPPAVTGGSTAYSSSLADRAGPETNSVGVERVSAQGASNAEADAAKAEADARRERRRRATELAPWIRDVLNVAHGDLRRLHQQDNLLHSYIVLARLRHEDDYNRINVLLSLVATIFLPLSFLTGAWGMNFDSLPLKHRSWSFPGFAFLCLFILFVALLGFWYRGWLNVVRPVATWRGARGRRYRPPLAAAPVAGGLDGGVPRGVALV